MARSDNFGFIQFLIIASAVAMLSVAWADYEGAPAPEPDAGRVNFLSRCASKLTDECGEDIFGNIFLERNQLTPECCKKLVSVGRECHEAMVSYIVSLPHFSKNASVTVPRSKQVWNKCALLAEEALSPA